MTEVAVRARDGVLIAGTHHPGRSDRRVVLVHSLALDRSVWDAVVPLLTDHAEVIAYDCRGHGRSGAGADEFTTAQFAEDLAELLDHVGWDSAVVAGCSMGGCVAQQFAGTHANRFDGGVFVDTTAWYGSDAPATWRQRAAKAADEGLDSLVEFQLSRWFSDDFRAANPDVLDRLARVFVGNDLAAYASTCRMLGDADLRSVLSAIDAPVAVVVGEDDYATPPSMAKELAAAVTGATLTVLPRARHLTPLERPTEVAEAIVDVLHRQRP